MFKAKQQYILGFIASAEVKKSQGQRGRNSQSCHVPTSIDMNWENINSSKRRSVMGASCYS